MEIDDEKLSAAFTAALSAGLDLERPDVKAAFVAVLSRQSPQDADRLVRDVRVQMFEDQDESPSGLLKRGFDAERARRGQVVSPPVEDTRDIGQINDPTELLKRGFAKRQQTK